MPVSDNSFVISRSGRCLAAALLFLLAAVPAFAWRGSGAESLIPLDTVGFQPQAHQFLLAGSSMMTLDYVDNQHILFTFGVHRLMKRIADDPPDDEDHMIEAVLLEVSSGRVLARTDWRLHDSGRYLWNLGHGRFLLRVRNTLTTFAPLANLATGQAFRQRPLLNLPSRIGAVLVSPESDLAVVEVAGKTAAAAAVPAAVVGPAPKPAPVEEDGSGNSTPVTLYFYRLHIPEAGDHVQATIAGMAHSVAFGGLPATGAGHLAIVDQGHQQWAFDFHPYNGKVLPLSPFDSSCRPIPHFVSSSEFISFGCHGGNTPQVIGGFNMSGDEMWEQNLFGDFVAVSFSFAPSSGRFAMARVMGDPALDLSGTVSDSSYTSQNVVVYQTESGKQIFHIDCSPIARAGQNFALSPDGKKLAVIREDAIEEFALPPLSKKDQTELQQARAMVPAITDDPIILRVSAPAANAEAASVPTPTSAANPSASKAPVSTAATPDASAPTQPEKPADTASTSSGVTPSVAAQPAPPTLGDAAPEQPRKPPTLYTLPTDPPGKRNGSEDR